MIVQTATPTSAAAHVEEHTHTKKRFKMWLVVLHDRVERGEYVRLKSQAVLLNGWWSRPWRGTPGGFAFKVQQNAAQFMADQFGGDTPPIQLA